jgi:sec-independent protein translocase protein TatA
MLPTFGFWNSSQDWLIIAGLAVLFFGGAKLPQLAKGLGEGIREFKKSVNGDGDSSSTPHANTSTTMHTEVPAEPVASAK